MFNMLVYECLLAESGFRNIPHSLQMSFIIGSDSRGKGNFAEKLRDWRQQQNIYLLTVRQTVSQF